MTCQCCCCKRKKKTVFARIYKSAHIDCPHEYYAVTADEACSQKFKESTTTAWQWVTGVIEVEVDK